MKVLSTEIDSLLQLYFFQLPLPLAFIKSHEEEPLELIRNWITSVSKFSSCESRCFMVLHKSRAICSSEILSKKLDQMLYFLWNLLFETKYPGRKSILWLLRRKAKHQQFSSLSFFRFYEQQQQQQAKQISSDPLHRTKTRKIHNSGCNNYNNNNNSPNKNSRSPRRALSSSSLSLSPSVSSSLSPSNCLSRLVSDVEASGVSLAKLLSIPGLGQEEKKWLLCQKQKFNHCCNELLQQRASKRSLVLVQLEPLISAAGLWPQLTTRPLPLPSPPSTRPALPSHLLSASSSTASVTHDTLFGSFESCGVRPPAVERFVLRFLFSQQKKSSDENDTDSNINKNNNSSHNNNNYSSNNDNTQSEEEEEAAMEWLETLGHEGRRKYMWSLFHSFWWSPEATALSVRSLLALFSFPFFYRRRFQALCRAQSSHSNSHTQSHNNDHHVVNSANNSTGKEEKMGEWKELEDDFQVFLEVLSVVVGGWYLVSTVEEQDGQRERLQKGFVAAQVFVLEYVEVFLPLWCCFRRVSLLFCERMKALQRLSAARLGWMLSEENGELLEKLNGFFSQFASFVKC